MDLNFVLEGIRTVSNDLRVNKLEAFCETLDEITTTKTLSNHDNSAIQNGGLRHLYESILPCSKLKVEAANKIIQERVQIFKEKQLQIKRLQEAVEEQRTVLHIKQKNLLEVKKQIEIYEEKERRMQCLKNCIRTYKLLTQTYFIYNKKGRTAGYVKTPNVLDFEVFEFNRPQLSQEKVTKKLWTILENCQKEDKTTN